MHLWTPVFSSQFEKYKSRNQEKRKTLSGLYALCRAAGRSENQVGPVVVGVITPDTDSNTVSHRELKLDFSPLWVSLSPKS